MTSFKDLGLSEPVLAALREIGYESPSPIQEQTIPPLLAGRDVIGQAQTGTGKTAAFGLPMVEYIDPELDEVQALVLTPTRELCIQVTQALRVYGATRGVDVVAVFGGAPIRNQEAQLRGGGHIVVGTVGRVLDLVSRASLVLHDCRYVVLDEAEPRQHRHLTRAWLAQRQGKWTEGATEIDAARSAYMSQSPSSLAVVSRMAMACSSGTSRRSSA